MVITAYLECEELLPFSFAYKYMYGKRQPYCVKHVLRYLTFDMYMAGHLLVTYTK